VPVGNKEKTPVLILHAQKTFDRPEVIAQV
jgi:hypothetical protein